MRRRTVQPEIRSFVLLLRSPVTPFDSANFTKNANHFEEWNVFGSRKCELSANQERRNEGASFWQEKVQNSSPILRCILLARKSAKLTANFSATMVTSLPSISLSLSLSLSLCLSLSLSLSLSLYLSLSLSLSLSPSAPHAQYRTGQDLIVCLGFSSLVARLAPFERLGTKRAKHFLARESVNPSQILAPQWWPLNEGETGSVKGETKSASFWQGKV